MAKIIKYSMPRGDSRAIIINFPLTSYTTGAKLFFVLKSAVDNILDDTSAVLKVTLTDANKTSQDALYVYYLLQLTPTQTTNLIPDVYLAEFEYVSADSSTVITYPDPSLANWEFTITGDLNRRIV